MDQIYKLQPHRTMALQGFDDYGAAAALWGASDTGFTVSGVFRDLADFAVLVLFQKDDPFGHPLFSYLPDCDLTGLVLDFDVTGQGIQSWESLKSAWTDWNTLDYSMNGVGHTDVKWIGTPGITITCNTTGRTGASAAFTLNMASAQAGDKVTLWYQNQSFISPAIIPGNPTTDQALWWQGSVATTDQALWWQGNAAYNHWVKIGLATYSCLEGSLNSAGVASNVAAQINASDPNCSCTTGGAYGNEIFIALRSGEYGPVAVSSSDGSGGATLSNYQHWVKIGSVTYSCYEGSLNSAQITGTGRSPAYQRAVKKFADAERGVAIRLIADDFEDEGDLATALDSLAKFIGLTPSSIDLIVDLGSVADQNPAVIAQLHRANLSVIPTITAWRTLTVATGAFPVSLAPLTRDAWNRLVRIDWQAWLKLISGTKKPDRLPAYGDYAIAHPGLPPEGQATILAQLRYTIQNEFMIWKGKNAIKTPNGYGQFLSICADLVSRPEFRGATFSDGDQEIQGKATNGGSPGNAETWRNIGTNHHIETVLDQIANLP
ncbi:MAG: beta family protein [Bryobacteraceae bacterium]|jgi:hypothetical protein